jgi:hypothetical protein
MCRHACCQQQQSSRTQLRGQRLPATVPTPCWRRSLLVRCASLPSLGPPLPSCAACTAAMCSRRCRCVQPALLSCAVGAAALCYHPRACGCWHMPFVHCRWLHPRRSCRACGPRLSGGTEAASCPPAASAATSVRWRLRWCRMLCSSCARCWSSACQRRPPPRWSCGLPAPSPVRFGRGRGQRQRGGDRIQRRQPQRGAGCSRRGGGALSAGAPQRQDPPAADADGCGVTSVWAAHAAGAS